MKPVLFAVLAMLFYALSNLIVEERLARLNSIVIISCYSGVIFVTTTAAWLLMRHTSQQLEFPKGQTLLIVLSVGVLFTLADYCYISAYTSGGKLLVITSIYILFPVVASVMKYLRDGKMPNAWLVLGYACAVVAILCIYKGSVDGREFPQ